MNSLPSQILNVVRHPIGTQRLISNRTNDDDANASVIAKEVQGSIDVKVTGRKYSFVGIDLLSYHPNFDFFMINYRTFF